MLLILHIQKWRAVIAVSWLVFALVNFKYSRTYKRVFEKQKSTQNEKKFAEMHANLRT